MLSTARIDDLAIFEASFAASSADLEVDAIPARFSTLRFRASNSVRSLVVMASFASSVSFGPSLIGEGGAAAEVAPTTGARDLTAARMERTSSMHLARSSVCAARACLATSTASSAARLSEAMSPARSARTDAATAPVSGPEVETGAVAGAAAAASTGGGGGAGATAVSIASAALTSASFALASASVASVAPSFSFRFFVLFSSFAASSSSVETP
mmetsp:Transcript_7933/g.35036  ORF Transcript_7933/g.35036 Transcript_7933/m.35036 type:complete len:215 (-) Transcript_7933:940-1584(-)